MLALIAEQENQMRDEEFITEVQARADLAARVMSNAPSGPP